MHHPQKCNATVTARCLTYASCKSEPSRSFSKKLMQVSFPVVIQTFNAVGVIYDNQAKVLWYPEIPPTPRIWGDVLSSPMYLRPQNRCNVDSLLPCSPKQWKIFSSFLLSTFCVLPLSELDALKVGLFPASYFSFIIVMLYQDFLSKASNKNILELSRFSAIDQLSVSHSVG